MEKFDYGYCPKCEVTLEPIWFKDIEFEPKSNIPTGRVKWAVNYLQCPCCLKKFTVDDSFDGEWFMELGG